MPGEGGPTWVGVCLGGGWSVDAAGGGSTQWETENFYGFYIGDSYLWGGYQPGPLAQLT